MRPLTIGPPALFNELRAFLAESGYCEFSICKRLGLHRPSEYLALRPDSAPSAPIIDRLDLLTRLFLKGEILDDAQLRSWVCQKILDVMNALGLIARYPGSAEGWFGAVALYPVCGVYVVSDRWNNPGGQRDDSLQSAMDLVYPAVAPETLLLLESLPSESCESFLDLCSGTGVLALVAAGRHARQAWATDINEFSAICAEFNKRLNGFDNLTVRRGDLYEAADNRLFDRIVANPPAMPSLHPAPTYAYGGELGDQITRRIIEGLPEYLKPGGRYYGVARGRDQHDGGFEDLIREWLGEKVGEFDVFVIERQAHDPVFVAFQQAARAGGGRNEVGRWKKVFAKHNVKQLLDVFLMMQRKTHAGNPLTVRRKQGERLSAEEIEWLRSWETAAADDAIASRILDFKPVAVPGLRLCTTQCLEDGQLVFESCALKTDAPFNVEFPAQSWTAQLIARCDGNVTGRELLAFLKERKLLPADEPEEEFRKRLSDLISGGFLKIEEFRSPRI
jgi:SAM-dependent methyltransferase